MKKNTLVKPIIFCLPILHGSRNWCISGMCPRSTFFTLKGPFFSSQKVARHVWTKVRLVTPQNIPYNPSCSLAKNSYKCTEGNRWWKQNKEKLSKCVHFVAWCPRHWPLGSVMVHTALSVLPTLRSEIYWQDANIYKRHQITHRTAFFLLTLQ